MVDSNVLKLKLVKAALEAIEEGGDPSDPDDAEQILEAIRQILASKGK